MGEEKILVIDANLDTAQVLKEHINTVGYFKIYLCTDPEILSDSLKIPCFQFIFADVDTIAKWSEKNSSLPKSQPHQTNLILVHGEFNAQTQKLMQDLRADYFLKKPYDFNLLVDYFISKTKPGKDTRSGNASEEN